MAHLNLSPSYVLQTVAPYQPFCLRDSPNQNHSAWKQGGPGDKVVFKGVTFHLGTLQPLDHLVWGKQLGLGQGGSPL